MEAKVNMSARIAKANREWVRAQAYSRRLTMSQVVDILIEEARKASNEQVAERLNAGPERGCGIRTMVP